MNPEPTMIQSMPNAAAAQPQVKWVAVDSSSSRPSPSWIWYMIALGGFVVLLSLMFTSVSSGNGGTGTGNDEAPAPNVTYQAIIYLLIFGIFAFLLVSSARMQMGNSYYAPIY